MRREKRSQGESEILMNNRQETFLARRERTVLNIG
jgi:hypothetical protein